MGVIVGVQRPVLLGLFGIVAGVVGGLLQSRGLEISIRDGKAFAGDMDMMYVRDARTGEMLRGQGPRDITAEMQDRNLVEHGTELNAVTEDQLRAALAVARLKPSGVALDSCDAGAEPAGVLVDAGLLDPGNTLLPALGTALGIFARPTHVTTAMANVVGTDEWRTLEIAANDGG
jgi:hypothetical protein